MARKFLEVYDSMITEKNLHANLNTLQPNIDSGQTLLDDLTTTSKVARWRLFFAIAAIAIVALENLWDAFKLLIDTTIKNQKVGSVPWYRQIALEFQYGDSLTLINNEFVYSPVVMANRVVAQCAVVEGNPLTIKVARLVGSSLAPLTAPQETAFDAYIAQRKFAGTAISIVNQIADDLGLDIKIYFDPLVLDTTGQLLSSPGVYPVDDTISNYLSTAAAKNFNGDLVLNGLIDALQATQGVVNPILNQAKAKNGANPYAVFTEKYSPLSGYLVLDLSNTTITYAPNV